MGRKGEPYVGGFTRAFDADDERVRLLLVVADRMILRVFADAAAVEAGKTDVDPMLIVLYSLHQNSRAVALFYFAKERARHT